MSFNSRVGLCPLPVARSEEALTLCRWACVLFLQPVQTRLLPSVAGPVSSSCGRFGRGSYPLSLGLCPLPAARSEEALTLCRSGLLLALGPDLSAAPPSEQETGFPRSNQVVQFREEMLFCHFLPAGFFFLSSFKSWRNCRNWFQKQGL